MLLESWITDYAMDKHILYLVRQLIVKYIRGAINHSSNDLQECMYYCIEKNLEMFQPQLIKIKLLDLLYHQPFYHWPRILTKSSAPGKSNVNAMKPTLNNLPYSSNRVSLLNNPTSIGKDIQENKLDYDWWIFPWQDWYRFILFN